MEKNKARTTVSVSLEVGHFSKDLKAVVEWCLREASAEGMKIAREEERDSGNGSRDGSVQTKAGSEALARLVNPSPGYQSPDSRSEVPYHTLHLRNWCETGLCPQWH